MGLVSSRISGSNWSGEMGERRGSSHQWESPVLGGRRHEGSPHEEGGSVVDGQRDGAEQASVSWRGMKRLMGGLWVPLED